MIPVDDMEINIVNVNQSLSDSSQEHSRNLPQFVVLRLNSLDDNNE